MRALLINAVCGIRSTGRICTDLAQDLECQGYEVRIAYGRGIVPEQYKKYAIKIGDPISVFWHRLMSKGVDQRGFWSVNATKKFIKWADVYDPDLLWLHNLHDSYINIYLLFEWIKSRPKMTVKWTHHDCWAFTGSCFHFAYSKCNQWQEECRKCPKKKLVSNPPLFRTPKRNFEKKKTCFLGVENMELLSPSNWLAAQLKESFLNKYQISVLPNKIDTTVFRPLGSALRYRMGLEGKYIILGVASIWNRKKGLNDFVKLSKMLHDNEQLLLVGLSKKQIQRMPKNVIAIGRTNDCQYLAQLYSLANVFLNLTYEDTYPTVNLEAEACGTPCITYKSGGSPESVPVENVVEVGDLDSVLARVRELYADMS